MNGSKILLDTNAVIALLKANSRLHSVTQEATWIGVSVISVIEFLSFSGLTEKDKHTFYAFIERVELIDLPKDITTLEAISDLRRSTRLKLPDAIICYASLSNNAVLISNDLHFNNLSGVVLKTY